MKACDLILTTTLLFAAAATFGQIIKDPIPLENLGGEVVNFETPLVRPILVTADGAQVVAVNEPDQRVVVRDASTLALVAEIPAGQGLTAMDYAVVDSGKSDPYIKVPS